MNSLKFLQYIPLALQIIGVFESLKNKTSAQAGDIVELRPSYKGTKFSIKVAVVAE